ncbi:(2Fe-2S)-binding protein [Streptomyces boninensis]|uniref:(2Fe-2S)-binding protein n=1 Tax=Streptomyces boninensis TaxID=2039455 RepID=UPI003B217135
MNAKDGWEPLPRTTGDYDPEATAFVQLPPEGLPPAEEGADPLAAPGHYTPPPIAVPVAGTDPAQTGQFRVPDFTDSTQQIPVIGGGAAEPIAAAGADHPADGEGSRVEGRIGEWQEVQSAPPAGPWPTAPGAQEQGQTQGHGGAPDGGAGLDAVRPGAGHEGVPQDATGHWQFGDLDTSGGSSVLPGLSAGLGAGAPRQEPVEDGGDHPRGHSDDVTGGDSPGWSVPPAGDFPDDSTGMTLEAAGLAEAAEHPAELAEPDPDDHPRASYVLRVNDEDRPVTDAWIGESLLYVLRERLGLAGAKDGCSQGECGACNVKVDGRLVASCLVPAATAASSEVRTVEGLAKDGRPSDVQRALAACGAVQCGFCIPGLAMTVHDLLEGNHTPNDRETRQALAGNLCRCTGYQGVLSAVQEVIAERDTARSAAAEQTGAHIPQQAAPGQGGVQPPQPHMPPPRDPGHDAGGAL